VGGRISDQNRSIHTIHTTGRSLGGGSFLILHADHCTRAVLQVISFQTELHPLLVDPPLVVVLIVLDNWSSEMVKDALEADGA
jgi:hypothetical protein